MDSSGNNRYELLFMDDDAGAPVVPVAINAGAGAGNEKKKTERPATVQQKKSKPEKENKPIVPNNKTNAPVKAGTNVPKAKLPAPVGGQVIRNKNAVSNGQAGEPRTMRGNNRGNFRDNNQSGGGEFGNELPQRQFRDRENRGGPAPRFRNGEKFGKREFDRQSGSDKTGIKAVDKREGGGAHNWGSAKQDIEDIKTGESAPVVDKDDSANEQSGEPANNTLEEEEAKQMTLDEWKALTDKRAKPNYNLRKAGEGVDNSEWKKMVVLNKKKESNSEDEFEYDPSMYPQRVGRLQRIVDIQFNFNDGRKGGFRKGPRGPGGPGPRGPGGPRSDFGPNNNNTGFERQAPVAGANKFGDKRRPGGKPLKVDDEDQFPTLS
ncbi:uncharacterized protein Dwil_GK13399 [Drosophila willistoni]|uniref:Hyaluronan/mRNA-binding protein domain-containing protein n=1 Tax=Drosophila willistoni TaxID=7260 RepID=B4NJW1_DROWI|nr:plasminogen activator inhibitor 1 RNA-binding protein [Drosophila willistoni]EDW83963.1 uncharacterized protein Dwil_GK13399 [Drosophila willistoni]